MFGFLRGNLTDKAIMNKLGRKVYIKNGVGFGFISDKYLYDNAFVEIGFGRVTSGRGDWGGGFEYSTTSPLKIVVDKNLIIQKVDTDSFYNSRESKSVEKAAIRLAKRLKVGSKLKIVDDELKKHIGSILDFIPCKSHIGHDVFSYPHMLESYTKPQKKNYYNNFPDPKNAIFRVEAKSE